MREPLVYPAINDGELTPFRVLRLLARANPDLFDTPECPYSDDHKAFLRSMIEGGGGEVERVSFLAGGGDRYEALQEQIALTLEDIRTLEKNQNKLDQKDKIQFMKAKPALLEKLIELEERTTNMRTLSEHMKRVYKFVDQVCTPDQRTQLMVMVGGEVA